MWQANRYGRKYNLETQELQCSTCNEILPMKDFFNHRASLAGKDSSCMSCRKGKKDGAVYEVRDGIPLIKNSRGKGLYSIEKGTKTCTECGELLELEEFSDHSTGFLGKRAACKACYKLNHDPAKRAAYRKVPSVLRASAISNTITTLVKWFPQFDQDVEIDADTMELFIILNEAEAEVIAKGKIREFSAGNRALFRVKHGEVAKKSFDYYTKNIHYVK